MSFEERSTSWALSLVESIESPDNNKVRLLAIAGGAFVTISMWVVHLFYPEIFQFFLKQDKVLIGVLLAPPFVFAFATGCFIYPQGVEPPIENETGPMATYFYQERASKRWKLVIVAGLFAAVNLLLMFIVSGV